MSAEHSKGPHGQELDRGYQDGRAGTSRRYLDAGGFDALYEIGYFSGNADRLETETDRKRGTP